MTEKQNSPLRIRVSDQSLTNLDVAAKRNGRSRNAEATARLEAAARQSDEVGALIAPLAAVAEVVTRFLGDPRKDPFAHEVLRRAFDTVLARDRPPGELICRPRTDVGGDLVFAQGDTPEAAERIVLALALRPGG